MRDQRAYDRLKRVVDVLGALLGLLLTSPALLVIAALIRWQMGGPVIFRQQRAGRGGQPFTLLKFRTMRPGDDPDEQRTTRLGRVLRVWSLDELPELLNVLCGDMSLVGPRPLLASYLPRYTSEQARRHAVRPGLTGLAQITGHDDAKWDARLRLDVDYVDRRNILLDLWILRRTGIAVVRRAMGWPPLSAAPVVSAARR